MKDEIRAEVIAYWLEKAHEALASARSEQQSHRYVFAVNRAYYACFYAVSAVLMTMGQTFRKHTGVRAALHSSLIKTDLLDVSWGKFYDLVFENRQRGDYQELVEFEAEELEEIISQAEKFVKVMKGLFEQLPNLQAQSSVEE
jgi:uncharacterized protein (UPF0332 family)